MWEETVWTADLWALQDYIPSLRDLTRVPQISSGEKKGGKKEKNEVIWKPNGESKASWSPGLPKEKKNIQTNAYNIEAQK